MPRPAELDCASVRDRLDPFLDDDLGRRETGRLRRHLEACPGCREELRLARELRAALRQGLPTLTCPPEVTENVLRVARSEAAEGVLRDDPARDATGSRPGPRMADFLRRRFGRGFGRLTPAPSEAGSSSGAAGTSFGLSWVSVAALVALIALLVGVPFALRNGPWPDGGTESAVAGDRVRDPARVEVRGDGADAEYGPAEVARAEREARMVLAAVAAVGRDAGRTIQDQVLEDALRRPARQAVRGLRAIRGPADTTTERRRP